MAIQLSSSANEALTATFHLERIPELDGLRGIAALAVFFHHVCSATLFLDQQPDWPPSIRFLFTVFNYGDRGVDLFFVLSGYLITSILIRERRSSTYYQDFYWKRILRILPLYVACLLAVLLFMHQLGYVALSIVFLANFASAFHVAGFGPFWSLAIEEQFYIIWPTVVRRKTLRQIRRWALAVGLMAIVLRIVFALRGHHNYYLTPLRCDGLAFGAVLACHFHVSGASQEARHSWDGALIALAVLATMMFFSGNLPLSPALLHAINETATVLSTGSLVGLVISRTGALVLAPLRAGVLPFFGLISYAVYMVNLYLIAAYDYLLGTLANGDVRGYWIRFAVACFATVVVSLLSRYLIELPAMRLRRYVLKHPDLNAENAHPPLPLAKM